MRTLRPSVLPMLDGLREGCPCFESDPSHNTEWMESGTDRHGAWKPHFEGDNSLLDLLPVEDREGVEWASDQLRLVAPMSEYPLVWNHTLSGIVGGHLIEGTPDLVCGNHIFDLKWRERDCLAQLACYAVLRLPPCYKGDVHLHALYAASRRRVSVTLPFHEARLAVDLVIGAALSALRTPRTCAGCGWCGKRLSCEAFNRPAVLVAEGREDWGLQSYHCTEIVEPEQMARAVQLATHLRKWCDSVDFHKREWAIKKGIKIPGYVVKETKGDREITDINEAYRLSGLPLDKFIGAASVGIGALKKLWAAHHGVSEAQAEREIDRQLASVITRKPEIKIVKEKV